MTKKIIFIITIFIVSGSLYAESNVPGGLVFIQTKIKSQQPPEIYYKNKRVAVLSGEQGWIAAVGIPLDVNPGIDFVEIKDQPSNSKHKFFIAEKEYLVEYLKIKDHKKVEPPAEVLTQISEQHQATIDTYNNYRYIPLDSLSLAMPVQGRRSSPFGMKRIFNNIPKSPHSGLDIAAPKGTKVHAAKNGIVTKSAHYYYSGNIIFIDHGQGFITSYCHLDEILVKEGQEVKTGDVIGKVGASGRVTGPHLHWSVSLNGQRVNPEYFIYG